jgi:cytoskeletal protein CcmA (bactofilin family)
MWRKQPEVKPSSPVVPSTRESSYTPPSQKAATPSASVPVQAAQRSFTQVPASDSAVLTRGICIKGELTGKADLVIDGDVEGSIRLGESRLTVGQAGHVQADIEASEIVVHGQVEGDLRGRERVVLGSSCHVLGDLEAPRVAIEDGARFNGRVEMGPVADARERQNKRSPQSSNSRETSLSEGEAVAPVGAGMERNSH